VALQGHLRDTDWKYVPNKSGGFMGFWWFRHGTKYLQLEEEKLCFKMECEPEGQRTAVWEAWHDRLMSASRSVGLLLKRPRFKSGRWMTVAVATNDYRITRPDGRVNFPLTLGVLKLAERVLEEAVK